MRTPHNSTIPADAVAKLDIQMLSLPSTDIAHGVAIPLPYTGEKDAWLPSGRNTVTLPPVSCPGVCAAQASTNTLAKALWLIFEPAIASNSFKRARCELPSLLAIQTLPYYRRPARCRRSRP